MDPVPRGRPDQPVADGGASRGQPLLAQARRGQLWIQPGVFGHDGAVLDRLIPVPLAEQGELAGADQRGPDIR